MSNDLEHDKLKLEQERLRQKTELKREALAVRKLGIERGVKNEEKSFGLSSSVTVAVFAAVFGFMGVVFAQWLQGKATVTVEKERNLANITLERQKFASSLVLKALENPNTEESGKAMLFLVDAGLLEDPNGKIRALVSDPGKVPVIGPVEKKLAQLEIQVNALECQLAGKIFDFGAMKCVEAPLAIRTGRERQK